MPRGNLRRESADNKPSVYEAVRKAINETVEAHDEDPTVTAYMFVRLCLLGVANHHGNYRAAEMAYKLADEISTLAPTR